MNLLPETRHSLLLRLANAQDTVAWGEFLQVYEKAVFRFALSRSMQAADAEDVTQRVLEAVVQKVQSWDADSKRGSFGAWLFRVTRNLAAKTWNDRKNQPALFGDPSTQIISDSADLVEASESDSALFHTEYRRALFHWAADRVREQVKSHTWQAFDLTAIQRQPPEEVAKRLGLSIASVYTAKCRIMTRIRNEIEVFESEFSGANERN